LEEGKKELDERTKTEIKNHINAAKNKNKIRTAQAQIA
jgi:hypothetical protein